MAIDIENDEIERLIRQLSHQRQCTAIQAIGLAVRNELELSASAPLTDAEIKRRSSASGPRSASS